MDLSSLETLQRQVLRAQESYDDWQHNLRSGPLELWDQNPWTGHRRASCRDTLLALRELPHALPNVATLTRWVSQLTVARVTWEDESQWGKTLHSPEHMIPPFGSERWSIQGLVNEAVFATSQPRRSVAIDELARRGTKASHAALYWIARRNAAWEELGESGESNLASEYSVDSLVDDVMTATQGLAEHWLGHADTWQDSVHAQLAMQATEGWPSRLTTQWLTSLFNDLRFLHGLRIRHEPLPQPTNGAQFLRAMHGLGLSIHDALRAQARADRSPATSRRDAAGALFGLLLCHPPFLRRRLRLGTDSANRQGEHLARTALGRLRLWAVQAKMSCSTHVDEARTNFETVASHALCIPIRPELAGLMLSPRPGSTSRLVGAMDAAFAHANFVENYDEDWFDNPRAHEPLREFLLADASPLTQEQGPRSAQAAALLLANLAD